jgi:hypothetical protein
MAKRPKIVAGNGQQEHQDAAAASDQQDQKRISIGEFTFPVPSPFKEGHVCSAIEAGVLNQTLAQNLRNNFAPTVKKTQDAAKANNHEVDVHDLAEKFASYAEQYVFAERRGGAGPVDPIEREAFVIAKAVIRSAAAQQNVKIPDVEVSEMATKLLASHNGSRYYDEARRRVESKKEIAQATLDLGSLRGLEGQGAET